MDFKDLKGRNVDVLAKHANVDRATIYRWLKSDSPRCKAFLQTALDNYNGEQVDVRKCKSFTALVVHLRAKGFTVAQVAKQLNVDWTTIKLHMSKSDAHRQKMLQRIYNVLQ